MLAVAGYLGYQWGIAQLHDRIQRGLSRQLNRRVSVESIVLSFPIDFHLRGVRILERDAAGGSEARFLEIENLSLRPDVFSWLWGRRTIALAKIDRPRLYLVKNADGTLNVSDMLAPGGKGSGPAVKTSGFGVRSVELTQGEMVLADHSLAEENGFQTVISQLRLHAKEIHWPLRPTTVTQFSLAARVGLGGKQQENPSSRVSMKGWVNWLRRDLGAELELRDFNAVEFKPYLRDNTFFANLESCRVQFTSVAKANENVLTAQCRVKISDIVTKPGSVLEEGKLFGVPSSTVWEWIGQSGKGANLEVIAKGHLFPLTLTSVNFSTDFLRSAVAKAVSSKAQQLVQQGTAVVEEGKERFGKVVDKTGIPTAVEKAGKVTEKTKESIQDLLP